MTTKMRLHPLNAVSGLRRYFVLLVIPLLRGLSAIGEGGAEWIRGAWIDLLVLAAIVLLACFRWRKSELLLYAGKLTYSRGLFWQTRDVFFADTLSALNISHPFYLRPFGAATLRPETAAAEYRRFRPILIFRDDVRLIEQVFLRSCGERVRAVARPEPSEAALAAAVSSNAVGGLAFAVTFLSNTARYLGEQTANRFLKGLSNLVRTVSLGLPPVVAIPLFTLVVAYLLEFLLILAEYYRFTVSRSAHSLYMAGGLFTRYHLQTKISAIESVDLRYGLFARQFTGTRVYVNAAGFSPTGFTPAVIPAGDATDAMRELRRLLPELGALICPIRVEPKKAAVRYTLLPIVSLLAVPVAGSAASLLLPPFVELITFWSVMAALAIIWLLIHRVAALRQTGMGVYSDHVVLSYQSRSRFHRVWIPRAAIARITVAQSARQARRGVCHVFVYETARRRRRHAVRAVDADAVRQAFARHGYPV